MNIVSFFSGFATISWIALIGFLVFSFIRSGQNKPIRKSGSITLTIAVIAVILSVGSAGMVFIEPQERGVVISAISPQGYREEALQPGLRWIIPFFESVKTYPISKQTYTMSIAPTEGQLSGDDSITARTSDGQLVYVDASVIYTINPNKVVNVHINWQDRYGNDLVRAQSRGIIRDAISQFGVEEVYSSKRAEMTNMISTSLGKKLDENGLTLIDFVLRNITFTDEYAASVEQKQIAEQTAQQAKFVVEQRKQEAEQARQQAQGEADSIVIRAKGDAESRLIEADAEAKSLLLIADAIKGNPDLLTYQYITKLAPTVTTMLLPSNSPFLIPLPDVGTSQTLVEPVVTPTLEP